MLCLATTRFSFADDLNWKFSTSLNYESGDFGTGTRTSSVYIPLTLKRYWGDWNAALTLPYLSQSSNGQVRNVGGRPVKTGKGPGSTTTATHSTLGDVLVQGGCALMQENPQPFDLSLAGKIKLPTADKNKGLGTGKFDEGFGFEFAKRIIPNWALLADLYYTVIGDPPGTKLDNQLAVDLGFSHPLRDDLTVTVLFGGSNALVSGDPAPRDLRGTLSYNLGERRAISGGVLLGLSKGSPDFGFSLGGSYRF